jgi:ABC-2 type transport system ATP-binding protein
VSAIIETNQLVKWFRSAWTFRLTRVLDDLNLCIRAGEIFGLIGPNGAGKTTAFKLLLGLLKPSQGEILFSGRPLDRSARGTIGFLPEQPYFYDHLTVDEILDFYGRLYGLSARVRRARTDEVIELLHLGHKRRARLHTLSKGTLQRVGIAQAILNRPRLAILDEPMSGLDPLGRYHMREIIRSLQNEGTTVLFSSHILPDTEAICSRVGILVQGRLCDVVDLHEAGTSAYLLTFSGVEKATLATIEHIAGTSAATNSSGWTIRLADSSAVQAAAEAIWQQHGTLLRLEPLAASLEECFLAHVENARMLD